VEVRDRAYSLDMSIGLRKALEQHQATQRIFYHLLRNYSESRNFEVL
jgi:hypothetical protein